MRSCAFFEKCLWYPKIPSLSILEPFSNQILLAYLYLSEPIYKCHFNTRYPLCSTIDFGNSPRRICDGLHQLTKNWNLFGAFIGNVILLGFFNIFAIFVTIEMSATTRMVLDAVRILIFWSVSLFIGWHKFQILQVLGVFCLVIGMCCYSNPIWVPYGQRFCEMICEVITRDIWWKNQC